MNTISLRTQIPKIEWRSDFSILLRFELPTTLKFHELTTSSVYFEIRDESLRAMIDGLASHLGSDFELVAHSNPRFQCLLHRPTELEFTICPGGDFLFGTDEDTTSFLIEYLSRPHIRRGSAFASLTDFEWLIEELNYREKRSVNPFLIATHPVHQSNLTKTKFNLPSYFESCHSDCCPVKSRFIDATKFCDTFGMLLPTEEQWECAAKAWEHEIFCSQFTTVMTDPEKFFDSSIFNSESSLRFTANRIGLLGLGACSEWTCTSFADVNAFDARQSTLAEPHQVSVVSVRGGAADSWPWQHSDEFLGGVLTARMPVEADDMDSLFAIRPVIPINDRMDSWL